MFDPSAGVEVKQLGKYPFLLRIVQNDPGKLAPRSRLNHATGRGTIAGMIVAIEGVSAAGKTTWCRRHTPAATVPEYAGAKPTEDQAAVARFWADVNRLRWQHAIEIERSTGAAFCDTDPLKLHYTWCLWQLGKATEQQWIQAASATRPLFERCALGFADRVLLLEPDDAAVRTQKEQDLDRRRGAFDLHLRMGPLLKHWYATLDRLGPGRVLRHAERLGAVPNCPPRPDRFSLTVFDDLIAQVFSPVSTETHP